MENIGCYVYYITNSSTGKAGIFRCPSAAAYHVPDLDFKALDRYFAAEEPTEKNAYTGMLEGYNHLIIQGSGGKLLTVMDSDPELSRYSLAKVV